MEKGISKYDNEKANKVKNELKLNVDQQQDAIKLLNGYLAIDDIDPNEK